MMIDNMMTETELSRYLPKGRMERILLFPEIDSTNRCLKQLAVQGAAGGTAVIAETQSAGRGRLGRSFVSQKGKGIYLSYLFRTNADAAAIGSVTAWAAVAVKNAVEKSCGIAPEIKWVNDLIAGGKKICGILTEAVTEENMVSGIVIGIGINVLQEENDFPPELREKAGSIQSAGGAAVDRAKLAAAVIKELDALLSRFPQEKAAVLESYRASCITAGQKVSVISPKGEREGFALRVGEDFGMVVRFADGTQEEIKSGEVSIRTENGYV